MIPLSRLWFKCLLLMVLSTSAMSAGAQIKADFTATPVSGCSPLVVYVRDISTGDSLSYRWELGNGTVSIGKQHPITTYFEPGKYTVKLVVTDPQGNSDSLIRTDYIVVYAPPVVDFSASDSTGCFPLKVNFTEFSLPGSGTIKSYEWDFGDGTLSSEQHPVHTYINAGKFTVTLRVTNSNGCVKVYTKPEYIKLQDGVKADFSYVSLAGCQPPTPVTFTNTSMGTGALTYYWFFGDGGTSTAKNPVHSYVSPGAYTVRLSVTNSLGCTDTITKSKAINIGFVKADFNRPDTVCAGAPFSLKNTSTPNIVASKWVFSDGTISNEINPVKTFANPGVYTIKLINDFGSCKDSITKTILIIAKPTGSFTVLNANGCSTPQVVTFQNTSLNAVSYKWDFGDSTTSTLKDPTHTYTKLGIYSVKLITTGPNGCTDTIVKPGAVKVMTPRILSINNLPARGCVPYVVSPTAVIKSDEPVATYLWDFGDGATSASATPSHNYTVPGRYNVRLIITTVSGCTDTLTMAPGVLVGTKPSVEFSATPRVACAQTTIDFSDLTPGPNHEWFWDFGDGLTSTEQNPRHNYPDTGYFDVKLVVINFGCTDTLLKNNFIQIVPPIAKFDTSFLCSNKLTRQFQNKSIAAKYWRWDFGDGTTSTLENPPPHTYPAPGIYTVILTVGNGSCEHSAKMTVNIVNEVGKLVSEVSAACRMSRVVIDVQNVDRKNISTYTWFFTGMPGPSTVTGNAPVAQTYRESGTFPVAAIITDIFGCKDTLRTAVPVNIYGPKVNFQSPVPGTCFAAPVTFIDSSKSDGLNDIKQWIWDFGDGVKQTLTAPPFTHVYDTTGIFNVSLKIVDNYGCTDSIGKKAVIQITKPVAKYTISDTILCPGTPLIITNSSTGVGEQYFWDFGDGFKTSVYNPVHTYTKEGSFKISLLVVDKYGCRDSMSYNVKAYLAKADYLMSDSFSSCPPLKIDFTNKSHHYTSFSWDFGDGGFSNLLNPQHIYTYAGTYTVKLSVKNNGGCTDTLKRTVTIQGPSGIFSYVPTAICNPSNVNFTAVTKNTVRYVWDFSDGNTTLSNSTTASHIYTTPGKYVPKLILEDASGCKVPIIGPDTIKVNYIETNITAKSRIVCDTNSVSFSDITTTNDSIGTFRWDFGDGTFSNDRNPVHSYNMPGWYDIKLVATSKFGCKDTAIIPSYIKVAKAPVIRISGDTSGCEPSSLLFKGDVLVPDTSTIKWSWTFGNGQVSSLQNPPAQTYLTAGTYPVRTSVINSDGCSSAVQRTVNIHPQPIIDAGADIIACRNTPVILKPSGGATYVWDTQPSLSCLSCESPSATPSVNTIYRVTGRTAFGCAATDTVMVKVVQPVSMNVGNGDTLCLGSTFNLSASGADRYQWSPATYLSNALIASPTAKPDSSITYRVIGTDSNNCFADTGYIALDIRPVEVFIDGDTPVCEPANLTFKANATNTGNSSLSWNWDFGNGVTSTLQNPPIQNYLQAGNYNIKVTVSNPEGCTGSKETIAQVNPVPKVDVGSDSIICRSNSINLQATGADNYVWDFKPSLSCLNCPNPVATPDATTSYSVTGSNTFGCTSSDTILIRVNQAFDMQVGLGDTLCLGENTTLRASGAQMYEWTPSTFLSNPTSAITKAAPNTTMTYQVIGKDSVGCFADTGRITVQVYPIPQIDILGNNAISLNVGSKFTLDTKSSADITKWLWSPGKGLTCIDCPSPVAMPLENTTYKVTGTNDGGCISTDEIIITVICDNGNIYIPNTFSPNGDGSNDKFFPRSSVSFAVKGFKIFNRWGQLMYEKSNISTNSEADGWDGIMNGVKLTPDVYVYYIDVVCGNGSVIPIKGNVSLIK